MRKGTVCFIYQNEKVLLALIEYSPEDKKWNGIGGVIETDESLDAGVIREVQEETFIKLKTTDLKKVAVLNGEELQLNVFLADKWEGELKIKDPTLKELRWFSINELPFDQMWPDNKYWLPKVLEGKLIEKNNNEFVEVEKFSI